MPMTSHSDPGGITWLQLERLDEWRKPAQHVDDERELQRWLEHAHVEQRPDSVRVPMSKHSSSGFTPASFMAPRSLEIFS